MMVMENDYPWQFATTHTRLGNGTPAGAHHWLAQDGSHKHHAG
jgi:hypothetical protein